MFLHSGYLSQATKYLPFFLEYIIVRFPFLHTGHWFSLFSSLCCSLNFVFAPASSSPIAVSWDRNCAVILFMAPLASSITFCSFSSCPFLAAWIESISFSNFLVSASSIIMGECFFKVSIREIPRGVAAMLCPAI